MRKVLLALVLLLVSTINAMAESAVAHGKLADGRDTFFYRSNDVTAEGASAAVMARCNQHSFSCYIESQFHSLCFAMVFGNRGGYAWSTGPEQNDANRNALYRCSRSGEACRVSEMFCDTVSERQIEAQARFDAYSSEWKQCQDGDDGACASALQYADITARDRGIIVAKREAIAKAGEERRQAIAELTKKKEEDEQQLIELSARRARIEDAQKQLAEQQERDLEKAFDSSKATCALYDLDACDRALGFAKITDADRAQIASLRNRRILFFKNQKQCENGSSPDCVAALASPALLESERATVQDRYEQTFLLARATALAAHAGTTALTIAAPMRNTFADALAWLSELPPATLIEPTLALGLATAGLLLYWRSRRSGAKPQSANANAAIDFTVDSAGRARPGAPKPTPRSPSSSQRDPATAQGQTKKTQTTKTADLPRMNLRTRLWMLRDDTRLTTAYVRKVLKVRHRHKHRAILLLRRKAEAEARARALAEQPAKTKEAQLQLRIAVALIRKDLGKTKDKKEIFDDYRKAAHAVAYARTLDPNVSVDIKTKDGVETYTLDRAAFETLYYEAKNLVETMPTNPPDVWLIDFVAAPLSTTAGVISGSDKKRYKNQRQHVMDVINQALAYSPQHRQILILKARALDKLGKKNEARAEIRAAYEIHPDDDEILQAMGEIG